MWFIYIILVIASAESSPIIGGSDVGRFMPFGSTKFLHNPGKYPYLVYIQSSVVTSKNETFQNEKVKTCGGVLIKLDTVLTAAHCLAFDAGRPDIVVLAGLVHRTVEMSAEAVLAKDFYIHEGYVNYDPYKYPGKAVYELHDIALVWLPESFFFSWKTKVATLADFKVSKDVGKVVGWGLTNNGYKSDMLQEGEMRIIDLATCATEHDPLIVSDGMLCAISDSKSTVPCVGDSGSPFVINGIVIGIVSWTAKNTIRRSDGAEVDACDPSKPAVFTKIEAYKTWIKNNVRAGPPSLRNCKRLFGKRPK